MKRISSLLLAALLSIAPVKAMQQSQVPSKFNIPWGNSAGVNYIRTIPQASQIGITNCAASLTDGFPPLSFLPIAAGGCPPFGQDFNGILKQITQWSQWQAAGGPVYYDSGFSTSIGGYPKGAIIQSSVLPGRLWVSTADNNTTNPDSTSTANWITLPGTTQPGQPVPAFSTTAPPNSVLANGNTVGNVSSNATGSANANTFWLFSFLWTNCSLCQLYNSGGGAISRGASAVADFNANDAIATVDMRGSSIIGADIGGTTRLTNVPVTSGNSTTVGSILGENLHTLLVSELASHSHQAGISDPGHQHLLNGNGVSFITNGSGAGIGGGGSFGLVTNGASILTNIVGTGVQVNGGPNGNGNTYSTGGGGAHNTVERSAIVYWWLSL